MRLTDQEALHIRESFVETFGSGKLYLFGSRIDDKRRGGDIDLYVISNLESYEALRRKIEFLGNVKRRIGEQKIDVVIASSENRRIDQEAQENGVLLCSN